MRLLLVLASLALMAAALTHITTAERVSLLRIPTGTQGIADQAAQELQRVGFGTRFDHVRTRYEIEALLDRAEMTRLKDLQAIHGLGGPLGDPDRWWIARNMTAQQPGQPNTNSPPPHGNYLPIDKRRYHHTPEVEHILRAFARTYRDHAAMRNVGRTVRGGVLWALVITGEVRERGGPGWKPAVLLTGSPHGNDLVGREMCLWIAQYLCEAYKTVSAIRNLLDTMEVYIVPDPSPDASAIGSRYTTRGVDLDRAFPDRLAKGSNPEVPETEVESLIEWLTERRFMVSASFLGGGGGPSHAGMVVRYPWNAASNNEIGKKRSEGGRSTTRLPSRTPDDRNFRWLARKYAEIHPNMASADPRGHTPDSGTVNGAEWYPRFGSMQDWMYHETGALHLDLVVSHFLKPLPQDLPTYWRQNRQALLSLLRTVNDNGLRGHVVDAETGAPVPDAVVRVYDMNDRTRQLHSVTASENGGGFGKFVVPGRYKLQAEAPGYHSSVPHFFSINASRRTFTIHIELRAH